MGSVLGGVGLGLVWGWLIAMLMRPAPANPLWRALALGLASLLLAAVIYALAGLPATLGLLGASAAAALTGIAFRSQLERNRDLR